MRIKYISIAVALIFVFWLGRATASNLSINSLALDSPGSPGSTNSFTLEDIYDRLTFGVAGSQSTFTEPSSGPTTTTGHTLNEIMAAAPVVDNTDGASPTEVSAGKTYWSLRADGTWGPQVGIGVILANPVQLAKTGQTGCWNSGGSSVNCAGTGQDGETQTGVDPPTPRFTDGGGGTVLDNMTGLIWLKNANCANTKMNWTDALAEVQQLNTDGSMNGNICGDTSNAGSHQTDWRLPNNRELESLIDHGENNPALPNGHPFTDVRLDDRYWSSTSSPPSPPPNPRILAKPMDFADGHIHLAAKTSNQYVWAVRGPDNRADR